MVQHNSTKEFFAMKVINLTILTKKEKELALGEPEILKKYDHQNMVKYIKDFQTSC